MSHSNCIFPILVFTLSIGIHAFADDSWSKLPIPPSATEVQEVVFLDNQAHQFRFIVIEPYPLSSVKDYYTDRLPKSWVLCSPTQTDWADFVKSTRQPEVYVHQKILYWADINRNRLLMLALEYESKVPKPFCSGPPDNDHQIVYLIEYLDKNIYRTIEHLKIKCGP